MKTKLFTLIAIFAAGSLFAADGPITGYSTIATMASGDKFYAVDVSDTSQSVNGTSKQVLASTVGALYINDTAFASGWNADTTTGASKNVLYDYLHLGDSDDDGKIDVLDLAAAGFAAVNSSGSLVGSRTLTDSAGIDITNPTGAAGDPVISWDATELGAITWGTGAAASFVWTIDLSGTDTAITFSSGVVNVSSGSFQVGGIDVPTISSTSTLTNKTLDASATGNVVKFKSYPQFTSPLRVDGTNCTIGTTSTTLGYGLATYTGSSVAASVCWAEFRILVPNDVDTSVDFRVRIADLIGADTSTRRYVVSINSAASSASASTTPATASTNVDIVDAGGASGDVNISSYTTMTGSGAAVTAGQLLTIRVARDGSSGTDTSSTASTLLSLELEYGATQ